jgi:hypothetical protein
MFKFRLRGKDAEPHYLTTVRLWNDGTIRDLNYSFVAKSVWSCKKRSTAEKMLARLREHYRPRECAFELVEEPEPVSEDGVAASTAVPSTDGGQT